MLKKKIGKELKSYAVIIVVIFGFSFFQSFLEHIGMLLQLEEGSGISHPWWLVTIIVAVGILFFVGAIAADESKKKYDKEYANQEKDERNEALRGKAGYKAWEMSTMLIAASCFGLFLSGHNGIALLLVYLFAVNALSMLVLRAYYNRRM